RVENLEPSVPDIEVAHGDPLGREGVRGDPGLRGAHTGDEGAFPDVRVAGDDDRGRLGVQVREPLQRATGGLERVEVGPDLLHHGGEPPEGLPPDGTHVRGPAGRLHPPGGLSGQLEDLGPGPVRRREVLVERRNADGDVDELAVERRDPVEGREALDVRLQGAREGIPRRLDLCHGEVLRPLPPGTTLCGRRLGRLPERFVQEALGIEDAGGLEHAARWPPPDKAYPPRNTLSTRNANTTNPARVHAARKFATRNAVRLSAFPSSLNSA